ncbi:MAG: transcriptional repressor [Tannerella sp.]|jgi:Fur family ferric uptake transcriptional regulator|nr:transcriptional repressor [Tannerella sp.]
MKTNVHHNPFNRLRDKFNAYLEEKGLRRTTERYAILECICLTGGHFDVESLLQIIAENHFRVSRASIYNTLELLKDAGLIIRHQFTSQLVRYELKGAALTHHHVVCYYCGSVSEIRNEKVNITADYRIPKFTPEYHTLYIYGMCSKCKFRLKKSQKEKK